MQIPLLHNYCSEHVKLFPIKIIDQFNRNCIICSLALNTYYQKQNQLLQMQSLTIELKINCPKSEIYSTINELLIQVRVICNLLIDKDVFKQVPFNNVGVILLKANENSFQCSESLIVYWSELNININKNTYFIPSILIFKQFQKIGHTFTVHICTRPLALILN